MSHEAIAGFWQRLDEDGALRAELDALVADVGTVPADRIVALGASHGFSFTKDELETTFAVAAGGELSDAQLEAVGGGALDTFLKLDGIDGESQEVSRYEDNWKKSVGYGNFAIITF